MSSLIVAVFGRTLIESWFETPVTPPSERIMEAADSELIVPIDLAGQRHIPLFDLDLSGIRGIRTVPEKAAQRSRRDLIVRPLKVNGQTDFDLLGQGFNTLHATGGGFGGVLLPVGAYMAGECDDTIFCRYTDVIGRHAGLPSQLSKDVGLQFVVVIHDLLLSGWDELRHADFGIDWIDRAAVLQHPTDRMGIYDFFAL